MAHELYISQQIDSLEAGFRKKALEWKKAGPLAPVVVLVGSFPLGRYLMRETARDCDGLMNLRFVTIWKLAHRLGSPGLVSSGLESLPPAADGLILERAIEKSDYEYLAPVKLYPGFRRAMKSAIRDVRDAGLVHGLSELVAKKEAPQKWKELHATATSYIESTGKLFYDDARLLEEAAARAGEFERIFNTGRLLVYGMYDFTGLQAGMLKALSEKIELCVFMPYSESRYMSFAGRGLEFFRDALGVEPAELPACGAPAGGLARLRAYLAGEAGGTGPAEESGKDGRGGVEIISAPDREGEVSEVARRVLALAAGGVAFNCMGVLLRHSAEYLDLIQETFSRAGIPYYAKTGRAFHEKPDGKTLKALIELIPRPGAAPLSRPDLTNFMAMPLARLPSEREWAADEYDRITCNAMVISGQEDWDRRLKAYADDPEHSDDKEAALELRDWSLGLFERLAEFSSKPSWKTAMESFAGLVADYTLLDPDDAALPGLAGLDRMGVPFTAERFLRAAKDWIESAAEREGRFKEGCVTVGHVMHLRGIRFSAVFVPGLVSRVFPSPVREDPILLDRERKEIASALGREGVLALQSERPSEDRLLFSLACSAAKDRLFLSWPRADERGGKDRLPSPFLLDAVSATSGRQADYSALAAGSELVTRTPLSLSAAVEKRGADFSRSPPLHEREFALYESVFCMGWGKRPPAFAFDLHPFLERALRLLSERRKPVSGPFTGRVEDPEVIGLLAGKYSSKKVYSASELEAYAFCAFSFLCKRLLRLEQVELPEDFEFGALETGSIVHELLSEFMQQARKQKLLPLASRDREKLSSILQQDLARIIQKFEKGQPRPGPSWEFEKLELAGKIEPLLEFMLKNEDPEFETRECEMPFGFGEGADGVVATCPEPVSLDLPEGETIVLRGKIDRVDVKRDGKAVKVVDYKTGYSTLNNDDVVCGGTALQRALYLAAAMKVMGAGEEDLEECEASYHYVFGAAVRKISDNKEGIQRAILATERIIKSIRKGIFTPLPAHKNTYPCSNWCDLRYICGNTSAFFCSRLPESDPARKMRESLDEIE